MQSLPLKDVEILYSEVNTKTQVSARKLFNKVKEQLKTINSKRAQKQRDKVFQSFADQVTTDPLGVLEKIKEALESDPNLSELVYRQYMAWWWLAETHWLEGQDLYRLFQDGLFYLKKGI